MLLPKFAAELTHVARFEPAKSLSAGHPVVGTARAAARITTSLSTLPLLPLLSSLLPLPLLSLLVPLLSLLPLLPLLALLSLPALVALLTSGILRLRSTIGARLWIAGFKALGRQFAPRLPARLLSALIGTRGALLAPRGLIGALALLTT